MEVAATDSYGDLVGRHLSTRGQVVVAAASVAMLLVGALWLSPDRHSEVRACGNQGPTGSTSCLYDCGDHYATWEPARTRNRSVPLRSQRQGHFDDLDVRTDSDNDARHSVPFTARSATGQIR
jgi:hypothetical protein